ncbi:MAG: ATP-binding protein [Dehalococcoidia bacterium]|nr:ATP-binding protein [Dehalococcoidia bacterium]
MSEEVLGRPLGTVVGGSLSRGVDVKLDEDVSVEGLAEGRYVTVEGKQRRFFGLITDVGLGALDPSLPLTSTDPFTAQVFSGTGTFGTTRVVPYLTLSGDAESMLEGPQPAKTIPAHFSRVREASERDVELVFGEEDENRFVIGNPLDLEAKVCLDMQEMVKRSTGVFGKTGTGKTFLTRLLLIGILQKGAARSLVFDMHNEYGWSGHSEDYGWVKGLKQLFPAQVRVFTLDEAHARRQQVAVDYVVRIGHGEVEPEDIELLGDTLGLNEVQLEAVHRLERRFKEEWFSRVLSPEFREQVEGLAEEMGEHPGTLRAVGRRLSALGRLPFLTPQAGAGDSVKQILGYIDSGMSVVLEFGRYNNELAYMLVANILTRRLHDLYRERMERAMAGDEGKPQPLVIAIEEAHKFLSPRLASQTIFGAIAREMRKFNVTLLVIDQRPSGIDDEVMSQVGTKLTCHLDNDKDIDSVLSGVAGKGELRTVLSRLNPKRQALILGHAVPMPVVVQVREYGSPDSYRDLGFMEPAEKKAMAERDIQLWGD